MGYSKLGKAIVAFGLSFAVFLGGIISTTSPVYAGNYGVSVQKSDDGKSIKIKTENSELNVTKKDDFNAKFSFRNPKGITENVKISVIPLEDDKYRVISSDEATGKRFEAVGTINPLSDDVFLNAVSSKANPNVLLVYLFDGSTPSYGDLVGFWGSAITIQVISNWAAIAAAYTAGGFLAAVTIVAGWPVVGAALAAGLVY